VNWKTKPDPEPGQTRVKKTFLLLPLCLRGEWRWFCSAEILQFYTDSGTMTGYDFTPRGWKNLEWNDKIDHVEMTEPEWNLFTCTKHAEIKIHYKSQYDRYKAAKT
jgi:hypothetical protein